MGLPQPESQNNAGQQVNQTVSATQISPDNALAEAPEGTAQTAEERKEEQRKIRRLQLMMNMVMSVISQDENLTVDEASQMIADSKRAALAMFPDKELAYNLIYKPRFQRLMRERYRIQ